MNKKGSELPEGITDQQLILSLYFTQIVLLSISLILGFFLFDDIKEFFNLFLWNDPNIILYGGLVAIGVVGLDLTLMKVLPSNYYHDGGLNERIFRRRSILHIFLIAMVVAIAEEILFRGILQTHFGLIISSLIFAFIHYRYLFNWYLLLNVIGLSFLIGYMYLLTQNLLVTIFMHFLIDFILGCVLKYKYEKKQNEQEGIFDE